MNKIELKYISKPQKIIPLEENRKRIFINALLLSKNTKEASEKLQVCTNTLFRFMKQYSIDFEELEKARISFRNKYKIVKNEI